MRVLDDNSRGAPRRLEEVKNDIEFIGGDVRDAAAVESAVRGMDEVHHLAFVNGTEFFYSAPELVLDVGVQGHDQRDRRLPRGGRPQPGAGVELGGLSDAAARCRPTRRAPLVVPDPTNPRYSYGGGKIISELMAINYGRKLFDRVLIFRPHNVYGPDMGFEHVVPQFCAAPEERGRAAAGRQGAVRDPGRRAADAELLPRRRSRRRRHGDAREGRASRHLSHRHAPKRSPSATWRGGSRPSPAARSSSSTRPPPPAAPTAAARTSASSRKLGYAPQVPLDQGLPPDRRMVLGERTACAEAP